MFLGKILGDEVHVDFFAVVAGEIEVFHIELGREGLGDMFLLRESGFDEGFADAFAGPAGDSEGLLDLCLGDDAPLYEDLTEFLTLACHACPKQNPKSASRPLADAPPRQTADSGRGGNCVVLTPPGFAATRRPRRRCHDPPPPTGADHCWPDTGTD